MHAALSIPAASSSGISLSGGSIQPKASASSTWVWKSTITSPTLWVPVIRSTSCDLRVLIDQPTKASSPHDPPRRRQDNGLAGLEWRRLPQRAVRAGAVVMVDILGQYRPPVPGAQDAHPVQ